MKYLAPLSVIALITVVALSMPGCGANSPAPDGRGPAAEGDGHEGHDHGDGGSDMEKMKAELAKLSPEDAASSEKQHICPVSGEMLGTMGAPMKVEVKGQQVCICCDGCKDAITKSPDEYLAKLKKE